MADIIALLTDVYKGLAPAFAECGFSIVTPDEPVSEELPAKNVNGCITLEFVGEDKAAKVEHFNNRISLHGARKEGEIVSGDFHQLALSLFEAETANAKDVKFVINDFSETLVENFGTKVVKPTKSKLPAPVSKSAAKSGAVSYDPNTLANRFTAIYPELRDEYKNNCEKYGEFLAEDFFVNHGNAVVKRVITENDPTKMRQLFKLFNDIYEDGTNETQSLICVTILGSLENNQELLANCVDYMSDDMKSPVINVNRYLNSGTGKGAKMRLENPPKYKPKKKSKSPMSRIGMQ